MDNAQPLGLFEIEDHALFGTVETGKGQALLLLSKIQRHGLGRRRDALSCFGIVIGQNLDGGWAENNLGKIENADAVECGHGSTSRIV